MTLGAGWYQQIQPVCGKNLARDQTEEGREAVGPAPGTHDTAALKEDSMKHNEGLACCLCRLCGLCLYIGMSIEV